MVEGLSMSRAGRKVQQELGNRSGIGKGAGAQLLTIIRSFWLQHPAFWVACLFLIMEYNRLQLVYPILDVIPWGLITLLLPMLLAFVDSDSRAPPASAVAPVLAFSLCVAVSAVSAFSPAVSFASWQRAASPMLFVLMLTTVVRTRERLFLFVVTYFLANLKMAQHGFFAWASRGFSFTDWGVTGSPGWFQNSGEFSMQMAVFLPLVLAMIVAYRGEWGRPVRYFFYFLATMVAGSIIASGSRGGLLGMAGVGLWLITYSKQRGRAILIVASLSIAVLALMPTEFRDRFSSAGEDPTSVSRLLYWKYGIEALADHPVVGIGFANWTTYVDRVYPQLAGIAGGGGVEVIHNTLLEAATELGMLGGLVYVAILWTILRTNLRTARASRERGDRFLTAVAEGTNGALLAYLITSFFMSVLYYPVIWMLLVFTACATLINRPEISPSTSRRCARRVARTGRS
jgi:putative inorganic carbon (HCO3(-)) transporter